MCLLLDQGNSQGSRPGSYIQNAGVLADIHLPDDLINAPTLLSAHVPGSESALPALPDAGAVPDLPHSSYPGRSMEPSDAAISFPQR